MKHRILKNVYGPRHMVTISTVVGAPPTLAELVEEGKAIALAAGVSGLDEVTVHVELESESIVMEASGVKFFECASCGRSLPSPCLKHERGYLPMCVDAKACQKATADFKKALG